MELGKKFPGSTAKEQHVHARKTGLALRVTMKLFCVFSCDQSWPEPS